MNGKIRSRIVGCAIAAAAAAAGCERDTSGLEPVPPNTDPVVFDDDFGDGVDFQAFLGSKVDAVSIETANPHSGTACLGVVVPGPGDPSGTFAGGAFTTGYARDLSGYNALTLWARAGKNSTLNVAGLGNDNTGTSRYEASWSNIPLTTEWQRVVIPVPLPARLNYERGLFYFAEGAEGGESHMVWFDDVRFDVVTSIADPRPALTGRIVSAFAGSEVTIQGTRTTFAVDGADRVVDHMAGYFAFVSSDESVAIPAEFGVVRVVGPGSAAITGRLGGLDAAGTVTIAATAPPPVPAPAPTLPASSVISLFSDAYPDRFVDTWSATWDQADVTDLEIDGDEVKGYTNVSYAGIEFTSQPVDASGMTHLHVDVWVPNSTAFRLKLVDFGADGVFGGGNDSEQELTFTPSTQPPFMPGTWAGLDIPLAGFDRLQSRAHLAQIILSGGTPVFIDNLYFHK